MDCYVISVHHTLRSHRYVTIWRPDDKGYCWALSRAGKYPMEKVLENPNYYNSGCANVAVPCSALDEIAVPPIPGHHDNDAGPCVQNTRENWGKIIAAVVAKPAHVIRPEFPGARKQKGGAA